MAPRALTDVTPSTPIKDVSIHCRIPSDLRDAVTEVADRCRWTFSHAVRVLLELAIDARLERRAVVATADGRTEAAQ